MTIQKKLMFGFLIVAAIVLVCSIFGIWNIRKIDASLEYVTGRAWKAANAAMQTSIDNLTRIVAAEEYLKGDRDQARFLIRRAENRFNAKFEELRQTGLADETILSNIRTLWNKLSRLEAQTLADYHLRNRTKQQLDQNSLIWTKTMEKMRNRLVPFKAENARACQEAENTLVSVGLLSLAERAAVNNYLAGSIRESEIPDVVEGFRSNIHRRLIELGKNPLVSPEDTKTIQSIYSESENLTEKLIRSHRDYRIQQAELSYNTLRLVEAFENIKEQMNENMERSTLSGRSLVKTSERYFFIFTFAALILAILIGVSITRRITHPIYVLTNATDAMAKGDLAQRVDIRTKDEIGMLSRSFNRMASDIHRYTQEIRQKSLQAELANQELQVTNKELYQALQELEKQSEVLKETNRELEKATKSKSEFLANMSHELRTPMNSIIGFTRLVLKKSEQSLETKQKENLQKVLTSADQLLSQINSILDLSKIESGRMEVYVEPFLMADVVEQVREVLTPMLSERGLRFACTIDPSLPRIYSDMEKVKQIVMNLTSNAVKFTEKGQITLTINRILANLHDRPSTDCMEILVQDTGIGIRPSAQPIIFDDFRQADGSTTREHGGTGLGLSICNKLCTLLGGSVELLHSTPGKGSTFRVLLPVDYEIEKRLTDNPAAGEQPAWLKILALDEDPNRITQLKGQIALEKVQIVSPGQGESCLDAVKRVNPSVILLNALAWGGDTWKILCQIKSDSKTVAIPVLLFANGGQSNISLPFQVDDYLVKPLEKDLFNKSVVRHLAPDRKKVLVADADSGVHETSENYLGRKGFSIRFATSVDEMNETIGEFHPDLIILDPFLAGTKDSGFLETFVGAKRPVSAPVLLLLYKNPSASQQKLLEECTVRLARKSRLTPVELKTRIVQMMQSTGKITNLF